MIKGVDLSTWQRDVDYQALKDNGIEFAILRVGFGKDAGQKDEMFETHYAGCKEVGIKVGVYHYSYCSDMNNAIKEAENCLSYLDGKELDLPVFYDLEESSILSHCDPTEISIIFANKIKENGYDAGVYASLNWFKNYIEPYALLNEDIKLWVAQWNNELTADFPVDVWQYTNSDDFGFDGDYLINELLLNEDSSDFDPSDDVIELDACKSMAVDVIYGKYGNGNQRKEMLGNYYETVQDIVNDMYEIIKGE